MATTKERIDKVCMYHVQELIEQIPVGHEINDSAKLYSLCEHLVNHGMFIAVRDARALAEEELEKSHQQYKGGPSRIVADLQNLEEHYNFPEGCK